MSGRHAGPPLGSEAREATASPWHGQHRAEDHDERAERIADERWSDPEDTHQGGPDDV